LARRSAASRSAVAAPFESSRRNESPAWRMREAAPFSSDSAFSIPGMPPSLRAASPATSSVRLPIADWRSAWARAASRSCGVIASDARGASFARSSEISCARARASPTASARLSRSGSRGGWRARRASAISFR
jgi:hypothetical protein